MSDDNIIGFPGAPIGSRDEPETSNIVATAGTAWEAAAKAAIHEGAVWGCIVFVDIHGDLVRIPINTCHVSLRGLFETALDDLKLERV